MSRRKGPKVEAFVFPVEFWVWTLAQFQNQQAVSPAYLSRADAERHTPHMHLSNGYRLVRLVLADTDREAVVRAAVRHYVAHGSRTHSNTCDVCAAVERMHDAAVEKLQRKGRKP